MAAVWPDTAVDENNLSQQISLLRKTLGRDREQELIETVPRRGYRFVAPVRKIEAVPGAVGRCDGPNGIGRASWARLSARSATNL
jgi:DNA-binding winged helix-turn-helix (wHTH) protein